MEMKEIKSTSTLPSIRGHLMGMLGIFTALFFGLTLILYFNSRSIFADGLERDLTGDVEWMASLIKANPNLIANTSRTDSLCRAISKFKGFRITIIDSTGKVTADSHVDFNEVPKLENHSNRPEIIEAREKGLGHAWRHSNTLGMQMLYIAYKLPDNKGYLRAAAGPTALLSFQTVAIRIFSLFLGLFFIAAFTLLWWISSKISTPLLNIMQAEKDKKPLTFPRWEVNFREAEILNRVFQGYVEEIRDLGNDMKNERDKLVIVLNQLQEGIIILNSEGFILAANPASLSLLGLIQDGNKPDDWIGKKATESLKHKGLTDWLSALRDSNRPPVLHVDKTSETPFDLLCHLATLDTESDSREYLLTMINVTEFRNLDRVKSEFVANASHELKTPLSSIKGYAEALLEGALADKKMREPFVQKIHNNALRLERLVQDLLSLSHLEANPVPREMEPLPLRGYVNAAINLHRQVLDNMGIRVDNRVPDKLRILLEPRDLELILNNLIGNAVKYNKPGGKIKIWVDESDGQKLPADSWCKLSVADTGIGIPTEMLPRIFERFYRAGASRASKEGTGLGLAIVKHAAHKNGMNVTAESILGEGSRFQIEIPGNLIEERVDNYLD